MAYEVDGKQYHLQIKTGDIGEYVILPGDPKRCEKIAKYLTDSKLVADSREYVTYTGYIGDTKVSVTSTGIGGPSASIAMEELVACGGHTFVRVGTCGGIDTSVKGGDLIVVTGSIRMEGTSKEYAPIEFPAVADIDIVNSLSKACEAKGYEYHRGISQCKDSFYGQHSPQRMGVSYELENKWEAWKRLGAKGSEMESAALYVVASQLGVRCGSILYVIGNQEREKDGLENIVKHNTEEAIEVGIESIKILIEEDKKK